jgi:hypothetical protein
MLKPEVSIPSSIALGALVWGVYQVALPPIADIRTSEPQHPDVAASERTATWAAAAVVGGVSLVARDMNIFIVGGSMVIALAWWYRHADEVSPHISGLVNAFTGEDDQVAPEAMEPEPAY